MATGTNGIATEGEAKSKLGYSGSVNTNKCCTKARAIVMGADSSKLTSYKDNQLVKYSDLSKFVPKYNCTFDFNRITAEGSVKINCGNKENWYSNSGIIAGFIDDNLAKENSIPNGTDNTKVIKKICSVTCDPSNIGNTILKRLSIKFINSKTYLLIKIPV